MPGQLVAIADHAFAPVDAERRIFAEVGMELRVGQAMVEDAVIELCRGADAILCDGAPITRRVLEALPTVRVVSEYGIGYDNIDAAAATDLGVWVANVPGFCTQEVADHALALVLALARRLVALDRVVRSGGWGAESAGPIRRLASQTVGLIGFGRIGQTTARKAAAFGFRVLAHSPSITPERAHAAGAEAATLERVLSEADYVVLQAPATPATRGMIGTAALAAMKPTSYLVNVGRGALVDTGALVDALRSGGIAGAALDVFPEEPLGADSPLRGLDNVLLTPHTAFYSEESMVDLQEQAARNVIAVLQGGAPNTPVNPEVASRLRHP